MEICNENDLGYVRGRNRPNHIRSRSGKLHDDYSFVSNALNLLFFYLILRVFRVQESGITGMIFLMIWAGSIVNYLFVFVGIIYIQKTILKLNLNPWPTLGAPPLSLGIILLLNLLVKSFVYNPLLKNQGFLIAVLPMVLVIFITSMYAYFPLTALLGGWDNGNLKDFAKCAKMAGPSKFLVSPVYRLVENIGTRSPLFGKFEYDRSVAEQEAMELMEMKEKGEIQMKSSI